MAAGCHPALRRNEVSGVAREGQGGRRAGHDPPIPGAKMAGYADANPPYGDAEHRFAIQSDLLLCSLGPLTHVGQ